MVFMLIFKGSKALIIRIRVTYRRPFSFDIEHYGSAWISIGSDIYVHGMSSWWLVAVFTEYIVSIFIVKALSPPLNSI